MIGGSSISRFLNNREIKDPQTNRYICRLYGFTRSKCWLASPQLPACRRLLFPLSASNKGISRKHDFKFHKLCVISHERKLNTLQVVK